jgi:hypothetical protein
MSNLQDRLDEFKTAFESGVPPYNAPREAIEKMHRATAVDCLIFAAGCGALRCQEQCAHRLRREHPLSWLRFIAELCYQFIVS